MIAYIDEFGAEVSGFRIIDRVSRDINSDVILQSLYFPERKVVVPQEKIILKLVINGKSYYKPR